MPFFLVEGRTAHLFLYFKIITSLFSTFLDTSILLLAALSFIPCSGSPLSTNVGYSGSISFNEKDGGRTDGDKASLWRRAAFAVLTLQGTEIGRQTCNFP